MRDTHAIANKDDDLFGGQTCWFDVNDLEIAVRGHESIVALEGGHAQGMHTVIAVRVSTERGDGPPRGAACRGFERHRPAHRNAIHEEFNVCDRLPGIRLNRSLDIEALVRQEPRDDGSGTAPAEQRAWRSQARDLRRGVKDAGD